MNLIEEPYFTPPGSIDFPFCYVYDASALTDGSSYQAIQLGLMNDSDFILRHVAGVPLCVNTPALGGKWNLRQPSSQQYVFGSGATSVPFQGIVPSNNHTVVPEKYFPSGTAIYFDLNNVLRDGAVCGQTGTIYDSQIAFWGVKRFGQGAGYRTGATPYDYKEKKYGYLFDLSIDWAYFSGTVASPPHRFRVQLDNMDFELLRIAITKTTAGSVGPLVTNDFQIVLYDASMHATSNLPMNQSFLNAAKPTPQTQPIYEPALAPTLVYPGGGAITFDIQSLLCNPVPTQTYNIFFDGIWRIPC